MLQLNSAYRCMVWVWDLGMHAGIAMHCYLMLQRRRLELERLVGEKKAHFNCRDMNAEF